MADVLLRKRRGGVEILTVNRPDALNALDASVLDALKEAVSALSADEGLRAVVVAGAGGKAFVAGADIAAMAALDPVQAAALSARGQAVFDGLSALPVPVIAAVGGFALGGGCELAMACDIILAGDKAKFGQPEVKLGVIPGFGGTQRLVRRVGRAVALDLCLTGRMIRADEALRIGLCSRVVQGDVLAAALEVADGICALAPVAVRLCKQAIHDHADGALAAGQAAEQTLFGLCFATADQREGMAAFLEKRAASFVGG